MDDQEQTQPDPAGEKLLDIREQFDSHLSCAPLKDLSGPMARLFSWLEWERANRMSLERRVHTHSQLLLGVPTEIENKPGIIHVLADIRATQKRNHKILIGVASTLAGYLAIEFVKALPMLVKLLQPKP